VPKISTPPALVEILAIADPGFIMRRAGLVPDIWQQRLCDLQEPRALFLVCRQAGKSTAAAALGLSRMIEYPDAPVIIVTPTERQSQETLRKCRQFLSSLTLGLTVERESMTTIELSNGSRMLALPGKPTTIRGFSDCRLIIMDEAAWIDDEVYAAVEPMVHAQGQIILMSTPFGQRGMFYHAWQIESDWRKICVTAEQVPRRYPDHVLATKRADPLISPRQYAQEYLCEFVDTVDAVFALEDIQSCITTELQPLYGAYDA